MSGTTSRRLAGVASLTIDGDAWDVVSELEYSPVTVTREIMVGQSGIQGYSEMPKPGYMSMNLRDRADATVLSLNQKTNCTIVAQLANGKTVMGTSMVQTGEIGVNTQEASFSVKFESSFDGSVVETTV